MNSLLWDILYIFIESTKCLEISQICIDQFRYYEMFKSIFYDIFSNKNARRFDWALKVVLDKIPASDISAELQKYSAKIGKKINAKLNPKLPSSLTLFKRWFKNSLNYSFNAFVRWIKE
jgi:hypothetical protein